MYRVLQAASAVAIMMAAAPAAQATTFDFKFGDLSWSIDDEVAPFANDADGVAFTTVETMGGTDPVVDIDFFSAATGGGLRLTDFASGDILGSYSGPVLYTVANTKVAFQVGTFDLISRDTGSTSQLTISAVPEPTSWALMVAGFGAAAMGLRARRGQGAALSTHGA